jgi:H+-translocating diphosphatase
MSNFTIEEEDDDDDAKHAGNEHTSLISHSGDRDVESAPAISHMSVHEITEAISEGAASFLKIQYLYMWAFLAVFGVVLLLALGSAQSGNEAAGDASRPDRAGTDANTKTGAEWKHATLTVIGFVVGALTSTLAGYIGMKVAVYSNGRTALESRVGVGEGFLVAFRGGSVMGFTLVSLGVLFLLVTTAAFRYMYKGVFADQPTTEAVFEAVAGFGLGGSCAALFGRVGGGIYTKAADVGADLVGKVEAGIPEDDPRNPAVIADNVGDNVGDVAGMGSDLFGSFAESTCASMVLASQSDLFTSWASTVFPITITAAGIVGSVFTSWFATSCCLVRRNGDVEKSLKRQLIISTVVMTPATFVLSYSFLPDTFHVHDIGRLVHNYECFYCIAAGLWSGLIIGYVTEFYTSFTYSPVREVANACRTGAATNIIYGLALGYKSTVIPAVCLMVTIFISHGLAGMYGISLAALGILSTLCTGLTIDAYGPISDNAGGIAEMANMGTDVREITDCLDAAGNTTAAIGKGFAIGSAALVSLALFGAFINTRGLSEVNILKPLQFGGLLFGAMLPYWFSAMTMRSVGQAALAMVNEVREQFRNNPGIMAGTSRPDYARCVAISTRSSLSEMMAPSALVLLSPLCMGFGLGTDALAGMLAGALTSGVQMAISASNTGGAWDNAKKYIEAGHAFGKGTDEHKAAVVGDTVGDPLKDTSGPSLNILIKLMAIVSLVFAPSLPTNGYLTRLFVG